MTIRKSSWLAVLLAAPLLLLSSPSEAQQTRVQVGVLTCQVAGGAGFIFGSSKALECILEGPKVRARYTGTIQKFGVDLGFTTKSAIAWAVFAPTTELASRALEGNYAGVSGEATIGLGANALLGGSGNSVALQPLSVQAQQGLNLAVGISALSLRALQ